jgi:hypothetical protein
MLAELRDRVRAVELERAAERARTGRRVVGRHAVLAQSWRDGPSSVEPRRNLRLRVATQSMARMEALLRNRAFAVEYARAREQWRNGLPAVFPLGTYWLHRFALMPMPQHALGPSGSLNIAQNKLATMYRHRLVSGGVVAPWHRSGDQ